MRRRRSRLGLLMSLGIALEGCALVAGLGDSKELGPAQQATEAGAQDAGDQTAAQAVAVGESHACAWIDVGPGNPLNGTVRCWGSNTMGQLGESPNSVSAAFEPQQVQGFPTGWTSVALALGGNASCALAAGGYLACWGDLAGMDPSGIHRDVAAPSYEPGLVDLFQKQLDSVTQVALNALGGCLLEGQPLSLVCWGDVAFSAGRTGADAGGSVVSNEGFEHVGAGGASACAATSTDVACWGANTYGQSGGPVGGTIENPRLMGLSGDFVQVVAGADFACALTSGGQVLCWGDNGRGQLGPNGPAGASTGKPVTVPFAGSPGASALAAGDSHVCALMTDSEQSVRCWGDNATDQLGVGPTPAYSATPLTVQRPNDGGIEELPHVQQIAAGGGTTCVVRSTAGRVVCWGENESGQAGQPPGKPVPYATPVNW